jgi:hypothetical protein
MDARAGKPTTREWNCAKRASIAGSTVIVGGMKTAIGGAPIATGMTTTTITTVIGTAIATVIARHGNLKHSFCKFVEAQRITVAPLFLL